MRSLRDGDMAIVIDTESRVYGKIVRVEGEVANDGFIPVSVPSTGMEYYAKRDQISHVDVETALKNDMEVA